MYTITLSNGRTLTGVKVNGSLYETSEELIAEDFAGGLKRVVVKLSGELGECEVDRSGEYENMKLGYLKEHGGVTQFQLLERPASEVEALRLRGDVDYIAMMTGVEL